MTISKQKIADHLEVAAAQLRRQINMFEGKYGTDHATVTALQAELKQLKGFQSQLENEQTPLEKQIEKLK